MVINEFDYDQPGNDEAEFIELKNISTASVNLSNFVIALVDGDVPAIYETIPLPSTNLFPGDYFVVCGNPVNVPNCDLGVSPDSSFIQDGSPDAIALFSDGILMDTVSYEGNTAAPYTEGSGVGLEDDGTQTDVGVSRFPDGLDTDQNNSNFSLRCLTPGHANTFEICAPPPPGAPKTIFFPMAASDLNIGEPNDNCLESIPLAKNKLYRFLSDNKDDWYLFDLTTATQVTVRLTDYQVQGQIVVWTGDTCSDLVFVANDGSSLPTRVLNLGTKPAGRYYIWVINDDAPTNKIPYHLRIQTN